MDKRNKSTMKKILITGGTVFVSRYLAEYYVAKGYEVYVLNRNTRTQSKGVHLINADRHNIGNLLREMHFDIVIDTGYTKEDIECLTKALGSYDDYIFISSSAVYPETNRQPFSEEGPLGRNFVWGDYGLNKIEAEKALLEFDRNAYILRPPYLYGPMNNVYREAFVFERALSGKMFNLPKDGEMKLQFFYVEDLCRMIDELLIQRPAQHIFNVGNKDGITIKEWVTLCYEAAGKEAAFRNIYDDIPYREYFCFYENEYILDIKRQEQILKRTTSMKDGLKEAFAWYQEHQTEVRRRNYKEF